MFFVQNIKKTRRLVTSEPIGAQKSALEHWKRLVVGILAIAGSKLYDKPVQSYKQMKKEGICYFQAFFGESQIRSLRLNGLS